MSSLAMTWRRLIATNPGRFSIPRRLPASVSNETRSLTTNQRVRRAGGTFHAQQLRRSMHVARMMVAPVSPSNVEGHAAVVATLFGLIAFASCENNESSESVQQATQLCKAAVKRDSTAVKKLLVDKGYDPNARHVHGWTALHVACINNDVDMVKLMLEAGADVNIIDQYSPQDNCKTRQDVMLKAQTRDREFSQLVDPMANTKGFTPLHYAVLACERNPALIDLLEKHHANPHVKDAAGRVAKEYADNRSITSRMDTYVEQYAVWLEMETDRQQALAREQRRLFPLEERVKKVIVGQDGPINSLAAAIRRRENGWHDDEHPLVFLFLGSSGLGKTELAKQLAAYVHSDDDKGFVRVDMTEYQSKHEAAKFIGSPPGYVGYEEGGQLTKLLAETPNAVVLLDEVEKAHPDVLNLMLQLFDEGRITDGQGQTIECKEAVFIMTSNLASDEIKAHSVELRQEAAYLGTEDETVAISKAFKEAIIRPILKNHFKRDEFLGRIDDMLYFLPFSESELNQLVTRQLERWKKKAKARHDIELTWDESVLGLIAQDYDVHYGARSLQHAVDQRIINRIAHAHEQELLQPGGSVKVVVNEDGDDIAVITAAPTGVVASSSWSW
eukprot:m.176390 g.176390  ORF g.176390 m.176390 type:complete len:615 (-) comp31847_c6_seq1:18-1862(-)